MKKKMFIVSIIVLSIMLFFSVGYGYYMTNTTTLKSILRLNNVHTIRICGFGGISLDTNEECEIKEVAKYLNSIRYLKKTDSELLNMSPDVEVFMFYGDGNEIDKIDFYGDFIVYRGNQYRVFPFMNYDRFAELSHRLNDNG